MSTELVKTTENYKQMGKIEETLEVKSVRPTAMRILIYKFMANEKIAVALTDIENAFAKADRTTLYRTIKTFEENGIVHQIDDGTGIAKYALCEEGCNCLIDQDLHLHFHCSNCDQTICLPKHKIPQFKVPDGFVPENVNLVVKGICDKCSGL
ncbi:Fur family transcriptional regulator, ferric uptake regulator [Kriegella aquimaris]|uniref:Fur family transcriptional regulator, ferric uptake regulator n=2 Tax=Kriegella aquimaris TaxID=192904 RepID=A0A1G9IPX3_9FLAO|nr:Fur family transcriptional regulator, ferric uptake regulator [Kriegella aquimaris]